jgi:hypothetical protein
LHLKSKILKFTLILKNPTPMNTRLLITLTLSFLFLFFAAPAQNYRWAYGFGGPNFDAQGTSIATDAQANVYVTGTFGDSIDFDPGVGTTILTPYIVGGNYTMFIAKYDSAGNFIWAFSLGGNNLVASPSLAINATGLYVTGTFVGTADFDPSATTANLTANGAEIFLAHYDLNGNYIWAKNMGGPNANVNSIAIDNIGNSYITGYFSDTADFDPGAGIATLVADTLTDTFFAKYDASGNFVWAHDLCDSNGTWSGGRSVALDINSNSLYISGYFHHGTIDFDRGAGIFNISDSGLAVNYIAKYDTSGGFIWAGIIKTAGSLGLGAADIFVNNSSNSSDLYVCGIFSGIGNFDLGSGILSLTSLGSYDVFFARYDANGNNIWIKKIESTGAEYAV